MSLAPTVATAIDNAYDAHAACASIRSLAGLLRSLDPHHPDRPQLAANLAALAAAVAEYEAGDAGAADALAHRYNQLADDKHRRPSVRFAYRAAADAIREISAEARA